MPFRRLPGLSSPTVRHVRLTAAFAGPSRARRVAPLGASRAPPGRASGTSRRPALPDPPQKQQAAPDFSTRSRVVTSPRGGATRGEGRRPSWASTSLQRLQSRESASRGRCAPATVRPQRFSRSRRLSPPDTSPGLFHPGNAPGIRPSGSSPPAGQSLSRGPFLSCRYRDPRAPVKATQARSAPEVCSLRESVPSAGGEARSAADTLLAFDPLGLSLLLPRRRLPGASSRALGFPKPRGRRGACAAESRLAGGPAFLLAERRPLWALPPSRLDHLAAALSSR